MDELKPKPRADVAIVTVKKRELLAAKLALRIDPDEDPENVVRGYRYWMTTLSPKQHAQSLSVVLTMVGRDRTVNCANACRTLFENYEVGTCVLLGMAAGPKKRVNLGDVVVAEAVWDYEGARLEEAGQIKSPRAYNPDTELLRDIEYFDPRTTSWMDSFRECFEELKVLGTEVPEIDENWQPKFDSNVILSGEKLVADDSIEGMRTEYHEGTRAVEMEASGFAPACEECGVPWLVFRGISDFGDRETKDGEDPSAESRKAWQATATLSAATAMVKFLEHEYRRGQDTPF